MPASLDLTQRGASLCEVEPSLGRIVGMRTAGAIGHRPLLPTLNVLAGEWGPPAPQELGDGVVALAVLDGLLAQVGTTRVVLGPGDRLRPWAGDARWVAGTRVRLAVLGSAFTAELEQWPQAAAQVLKSAGPGGALRGASALLDLLWQIGRRWGTLQGNGIALPATLGPPALAHLLGELEGDVASALGGLAERGAG